MDTSHYNTIRLANIVSRAVISQFAADVIVSLIDDNILKTDIVISDTEVYFGAIITALVIFALPKTADRLEIIAIASVTYNYFINLARNDFDFDFKINTQEIVFTIVLTELFTITFDKTAINDYYNKYIRRHHLPCPELPTTKSEVSLLTLIFISNIITYPIRRYKEKNS